MPRKKTAAKKSANGSTKTTHKPKSQVSVQPKKSIEDEKADRAIANLRRMARPTDCIDDYID
jgi:hypothetical protein